ncbi:MAG: NAD(P)/FAD-dependent oxidoreductase [Cyanobacteria bacterium P01_A01_bin.84]
MTNDYDVVIIGGTSAGRYAALNAVQQKARVALVEPQFSQELVSNYAIAQISELFQVLGSISSFGINSICPQAQANNGDSEEIKCCLSWQWEQTMGYINILLNKYKENLSLASLASQGVDIIVGKGEFQSNIKSNIKSNTNSATDIGFAVNNRLINARRYLLAAASVSAVPDIEGIETASFVTIENIWHSWKENPIPKEWVIIGGLFYSVTSAQILASLGCKVTLIVEHPLILPRLDTEIALLLQGRLEAQGIKILTETSVTQVKKIENKSWLQVGNRAIEADEILIAAIRKPDIDSLNLAAVGVKYHSNRLVVNKKLQTTNKRIFACGEIIGGDDIANIANYEAQVALKNSLFLPIHKVNYQNIPWTVFSQPQAAQVGLSEAQAQRRYGKTKIIVLKHYFKHLTAAQVKDEITGVCKLMVLSNGKIIGASILGVSAEEIINMIALAMSKNIKIDSLTSFFSTEPSFSAVLQQIVNLWQERKLNQDNFINNLRENFFYIRRSWNM